MSLTVTVSGDFCITPGYLNKQLISKGIKDLFSQTDINIVNLECPVNNGGEENKIVKNGPHLQTKEGIFEFLKQLNVTAVTLANNHILDYDVQGLDGTVAGCRKNNIAFTGVGENLQEAGMPLLLDKNGVRIAIVNCCENEWSVASEDRAGANPLDVIENLAQIRKARNMADFVLVIVHGGSEYYNLPSPRMVKQYRFFAENGADIVISHHTHCVGGFEIYNNVPIFYGLGNMIFTKASEQPGWFSGLTLKLELEKGRAIGWELVPTGQYKEGFELSLLEGEQKQQLLAEIENYSRIIADEKQFKAEWASFIEKRRAQYLLAFSPVNVLPVKYLRSAVRRLGLVKQLLPKKYLLPVINYICCEAHLDISREVLMNKLSRK